MVDLISCEACGNQVSSMATACPKCGHPLLRPETQKADSVWSKYDRESGSAEPATPSKAGLSIAWIVVAVLAIGSAWFAYNYASKSGGLGEQTQVAPLEVAIGDGIDFGDYTVTITDVSSAKNLRSTLMNALTGQFSRSDMGNRAGEGVIFVTVDYAVLNSSKVPLAAGDRPQIQLQDHNGVILSPDLGKTSEEEATFGSGKAFSDLNPGMTEKRLAVFEVAEAQYNPATWKVVVNGKALVSLAAAKSPTSEPAPSDQSAIPSEEVQAVIADDAETEEGGKEAVIVETKSRIGRDVKRAPDQTDTSVQCEAIGPRIMRGFNPNAAYPERAARQGIEGKVVIRYTVDSNGNADTVEVVRAEPPGVFDEAAVNEYRKMKWTPARDEKCQSVHSEPRTETVVFRLG